MCFKIYSGSKVARRDIVCYKTFYCSDLLSDGFLSRYRGYSYGFYTLQPDVKLCVNFGLNTIDAGYHSYKSLKIANLKERTDEYIMCYIPKGSVYYENTYEYVSESIYVMGPEYINKKRMIDIWNRILFVFRKRIYKN